MSQSTRTVPAPPATARSPRPALLLFGLLLVALAGRLAFTLWEPRFDGSLHLADVGEPSYWPMHLVLGGPSYAVSFVAAAVFLVLLGRGSVAALAAGLAVGLGGLVFSLAITAEVLPFVWAAGLPGEQAGALVAMFNGRLEGYGTPIVVAMAVIAVGGLVGLVAVLRAGTTPRWFPLAALATVVVAQLLPLTAVGAAVAVGYLLETAVLAGIGWFGWQLAR